MFNESYPFVKKLAILKFITGNLKEIKILLGTLNKTERKHVGILNSCIAQKYLHHQSVIMYIVAKE